MLDARVSEPMLACRETGVNQAWQTLLLTTYARQAGAHSRVTRGAVENPRQRFSRYRPACCSSPQLRPRYQTTGERARALAPPAEDRVSWGRACGDRAHAGTRR